MGAFVGERRIVTCAHVVNAALGLDPVQQARPERPVHVDFPLVAPGMEPLAASVVAWVPPPKPGAAGDDVAGLLPEAMGARWQRGAGARRGQARTELTILHVSDTQFGRNHLFGGNGLTEADRAEDSLFARLHQDLALLAHEDELRPDLIVVTGDLAEWGLRSEFGQVGKFLAALAEAAEVPRRHVAIVPGNHDVNRKACAAYFSEQDSLELTPVAPYFPKWRDFAAAFEEFYSGVPGVTFTPDEPWTLFEMPDLDVVVAGLNSTMAESHLDTDHYGWTGEHQLRWFARRLEKYQGQGWLRLAAVHHNVVRGAVLDDENLRDADDLDRVLGTRQLVNLLLHGHTHDAKLHYLSSGLPALSTGSAAVTADARPAQVPNQYQLITIQRYGFTRHARQYALGQRRWIGDTRVSASGSDWRDRRRYELADVDMAFPHPTRPALGARRSTPSVMEADEALARAVKEGTRHMQLAPDPFLARVAEAARVRFPEAIISERGRSDCEYLRVSRPVDGGAAEVWPVGVVDGPATEAALTVFAERVHAQFAAADPQVRSELVYAGPAASAQLVAQARRQGIRLLSFVEYQGLLDLEQRYRMADGGEVSTGLIERAVEWLSADDARLIVVLGDFGRGKTSFLRQLTRRLPAELPGLLPVLVELRTLEKAPTLDELLGQHLIKQGAEDINPAKFRYMIRSGRIALAFDGFDELELRVGYDNAADYLQTLLDSVTDRAKVILTSRTQHFRSQQQVKTALGARVETRSASRVVVLEDFTKDQILRFLTNPYEGDEARARARFDLLSDIENLLALAHNPRMLAFVAAMDDDQLAQVRQREGRITQAGLYREIIDAWLTREAQRQEHHGGLTSFDKDERLRACTALALRLWASAKPTIALGELSAEVCATLTGLTERGYSEEQATHSIASGSLLVRTDDDAFTFIHQSIMEWLVADAAAGDPRAEILTTRRISKVMAGFFVDLAGAAAALRWAKRMLDAPDATEAAKLNALDIGNWAGQIAPRSWREHRQLAGVDLRGQDLTGVDLRGADLRWAYLSGMRLANTDLSGADLRDASLTGVRMTGGSLRGADLFGSRWDRAAILGTSGVEDPAVAPKLHAAAIVNRDPAEAVIRPPFAPINIVFSPDGSLLSVCTSNVVEVIDAIEGKVLRILRGHSDEVSAAAFSPDGTLIATASTDSTARTWDTTTGTHLATLVSLADGGYATLLPDGRYKLDGDPTDRVWWAIKLCRFEAGELDPYVPEIKRLPPDAAILSS